MVLNRCWCGEVELDLAPFEVQDVIHTPAGERAPVDAPTPSTVGHDTARELGAFVARRNALPVDSAERKRTPLCTGLLDYFPDALQAVVVECGQPWNQPENHGAQDADVLDMLKHRDAPNMSESLALTALVILANELGPTPPDGCNWWEVRTLSDLFDVFAPALAAVAQVSWHGNEKHNPGQPLHHARGKSTDHADTIARHYVERGGFDGPMRHSACLVWRALAMLQQACEDRGAPMARGARK